MKPYEFIDRINYVFHPIRISTFQKFFWRVLGLLLTALTFGVVAILFYSVFFDRADFLNRRKMCQLLTKSPCLLKDPVKVKIGITKGYLWQLDLRTDVCWTEDGVFCYCNEDILFCTFLPDRLQKKYDLKMRRVLKASLKQQRREKKAITKES